MGGRLLESALMRLARVAILLVCLAGLKAQSIGHDLQNYHHSAWTVENGLSTVYEVQQAPDGFLWLGTSNGVFRFDGVRAESIDQVTNGIVHNKDLYSVFVANDGGV